MGKCGAARLMAGLTLWALASGGAVAGCAPDAVELRWPGGQARFSVEVADTAAKREHGLMDREKMPAASGMLFAYGAPQHVYYWMKNTLLPLDMIFADQAGQVTAVHSNAVPGDLTPIDGGEGVQYVLEINGGLAARMGIVPGAQLRGAAIDPAKALWSCAD